MEFIHHNVHEGKKNIEKNSFSFPENHHNIILCITPGRSDNQMKKKMESKKINTVK